MDPPVAISSSRTMARLPRTSPTIESMTTLSSLSRCLLPAATGRPSRRENWVASLALPRSGETTTEFVRSVPRKWSASTPSAVRWSTGTEKKPCTCGAWRFIVSTRCAPAVEMRSATSRPPSEMRDASFLSDRAYAKCGMTAVIWAAEAPRAASIMRSSSMRCSCVGGTSGWTM